MRALIQRVDRASVSVDGVIQSQINRGILALVGISHGDTDVEAKSLANKICNLRIFANDEGKMTYSIVDLGLELLLVSQFTLYANTSSGRRPDFIQAARGHVASPLFDRVASECSTLCKNEVKKGVFGAKMKIDLINDGPVTIWLDVEPQV